MEQRAIGRSGLEVSLLGLGGNNFGGRLDLAATTRVVHRALDLGVTLIDTADIYGGEGRSEDFLGQALSGRRQSVVIATKFGLPMTPDARPRNTSAAYVVAALEASLRRLRTDWIDLYQVHRPDPDTPIGDTLEALDRLVRQGKVRHAGCSNFPAAELEAAQASARVLGIGGFVSCQDQYSLLARGVEAELLPAVNALGLGFIPYFPLASGLLTGKYAQADARGRLLQSRKHADRFLNERNRALVVKLSGFAKRRGCSLLELAFGWLSVQPGVCSIIAGASTPEQLEANVAALGWRPAQDDLAEIDRLLAGSSTAAAA